MSQQINLYQPIFRKEEKKFSTLAMFQSMGILVLGVVLMYSYTRWQTSAMKSELQRVELSHAAATKRLAEATQKFGKSASAPTLDAEIAKLEREVVTKQRIQEVLQRGVFSNTSGFSDYFVSFARQGIPGVWLTGFDITGAAEQMTLDGRSTDPELVPRYMQKLSSEKPLSGIVFSVFQMSRPAPDAKAANGNYVEFQAKTAGNKKAAGNPG
ncbi:MAG: PilN domain-containing protein [Sulfuricaulis sp.]